MRTCEKKKQKKTPPPPPPNPDPPRASRFNCFGVAEIWLANMSVAPHESVDHRPGGPPTIPPLSQRERKIKAHFHKWANEEDGCSLHGRRGWRGGMKTQCSSSLLLLQKERRDGSSKTHRRKTTGGGRVQEVHRSCVTFGSEE